MQEAVTQTTKLLDIDSYNSAEKAAADGFSIRVNQAFFPEMFASVGYPARVERVDQLWRYIDVMHETRTTYNMDHLLHGLTAREFKLFKEVTKIVDSHATKHYGRRAHATSALLRALHVLRLIKIVTGEDRPAVLEVGPGCGYLAMLLVMEGYPYIGTDVAQAFYLYQSHMLSHVANTFKELVVEDGDIHSLETPISGTAIHIPWWKWVTLSPENIKLAVGIMTCNHCLCEMHPSSMGYLAAASSRMLANHPGGGKFVFDSWGYDLLHGEDTILAKFSEHGFRLCHNEIAVSAMALADNVKGWPVYGSTPAVNIMDVSLVPPVQKSEVVGAINRRPKLKKLLLTVINRFPSLKNWLVRRLYPNVAAPVAKAAQTLATPVSSRIPDFKAANPLSRRLTDGRKMVAGQASIKLPEIQSFLKSHFDGNVPQHPDEVFFDLIGTKC
jgi:hypothetical protein